MNNMYYVFGSTIPYIQYMYTDWNRSNILHTHNMLYAFQCPTIWLDSNKTVKLSQCLSQSDAKLNSNYFNYFPPLCKINPCQFFPRKLHDDFLARFGLERESTQHVPYRKRKDVYSTLFHFLQHFFHCDVLGFVTGPLSNWHPAGIRTHEMATSSVLIELYVTNTTRNTKQARFNARKKFLHFLKFVLQY